MAQTDNDRSGDPIIDLKEGLNLPWLKDRVSEFRIPGWGKTRLTTGLITLLVVVGLFYNFFLTYVGPNEYGIKEVKVGVKRGIQEKVYTTGLHFIIPGFENMHLFPRDLQIFEMTNYPTPATRYHRYEKSAHIQTSDGFFVDVDLSIIYRIVDPYKYLFQVRNVQETFRDMSEAIMRKVVGDRTVNEVLTVGRAEAALVVQEELQALCNQYETGIKVDQVVLQNVNPPDPVKPSFNTVNEAQQEREKLINQAQSEYNREIPKAEGAALQTIQEAEGYAMDRVNRAQGDASLFTAIFRAYQRAPDVTRKRMYLETMNEVLPRVKGKIIVDDQLKGVLPLLNLNQADKGGQ